MPKAEIIVRATEVGIGATVTGYNISTDRPRNVYPCDPASLTRVYHGFGKQRAETGIAPRRGFGQLIGCAEITDAEMNSDKMLWLRIQD